MQTFREWNALGILPFCSCPFHVKHFERFIQNRKQNLILSHFINIGLVQTIRCFEQFTPLFLVLSIIIYKIIFEAQAQEYLLQFSFPNKAFSKVEMIGAPINLKLLHPPGNPLTLTIVRAQWQGILTLPGWCKGI